MLAIKERLKAQVKAILMNDWDPICVKELPDQYREAAKGEYDHYIPVIIKMILSKESEGEITKFLFETEIKSIGSRRNQKAAEVAAGKLARLQTDLERNT